MIDKEIMDALCFLHSLAKKDTEFETQTENFQQVIAYIEKLETEVNNKWIPCEERLPSEKDFYLVTYKSPNGELKVKLVQWLGTWNFSYGYKPIAWMPRPQPYKESE